MKLKRFLCLFFVVLLAVSIPCAFLAGCNGNSGDDGTDDTSNGDKTGTGDEIFTEGMTLAQLRAATENIDNFTMEGQSEYKDLEGYIYNDNDILMINEKTYYQYGESEKAGEMSGIYEYIHFTQGECRYNFDYNYGNNVSEKLLKKSLLTNIDLDKDLDKSYLWEFIEIYFTDGETGLKVNEDEITYSNFQVTSSYVRLKGSVLEFGWSIEGKSGTRAEGETEQYDIKIYGINATVIDTSKVELADAEWADYVYYNGYSYRKAVDKDGNEYYYTNSYNSEAEAEKTINTLPVKPRES